MFCFSDVAAKPFLLHIIIGFPHFLLGLLISRSIFSCKVLVQRLLVDSSTFSLVEATSGSSELEYILFVVSYWQE